MKPIKFKSIDETEELIVLNKSIIRIMDISDMPYGGDNRADGKVYEYNYDVIINGEFFRLDEDEFSEQITNMRFVEQD